MEAIAGLVFAQGFFRKSQSKVIFVKLRLVSKVAKLLSENGSNKKVNLKIFLLLVIGAFVGVFIYRRLRPYIAVVRKVLQMLNGSTGFSPANVPGRAVQRESADNRLLRCTVCGTWIPTAKAIRLRTSSSAYCSEKCLEGKTSEGRRRAAS